MKRWFRFCLFLCIFVAQIHGLELEVTGNMTNLYFGANQLKNTPDNTFDGSAWFWVADFSFGQKIQDNYYVKYGLKTDMIQGRYIFSQVDYSFESLIVSFSPFIGIFNNSKWINPGFGTSLQYFVGRVFIKAGFSTTFIPITQLGDYYTGSMYASIGALIGSHGMVWLELESKQFTSKKESNLTVSDVLTKYYLNTEIYAKNFPVKWGVGTGCQVLSRSYNSTSSQYQPTWVALLAGGSITWEIIKDLSTFLRFQTPIMFLGWNKLTYNGSDLNFFFSGELGFRLRF